MAVYDHSYRRYQGPRLSRLRRILVIPKFAIQDVFDSRLFVGFFISCFAYPIGALVVIYLRYQPSVAQWMGLQGTAVDKVLRELYQPFYSFQFGVMALILTLIVAPALVSPDLKNNGLPLYLARPISRADYVLGKMSILVILLSLVTWMPMLVVWSWHAYLADWQNPPQYFTQLPMASLVTGMAWIVVLSLSAMLLSAWVKRKHLVRALLLMVFVATSGLANMTNGLFDTGLGTFISPGDMVGDIWRHMTLEGHTASVSMWAASCGVMVFSVACLVLINRKLHAYDIVS